MAGDINGYPVDKCKVLSSFYMKVIQDIEYDIQNRKYVAFVGRISPEKGIPLLMEVARKLPEIAFQLAGNARPGYLDQLNIPKNVIFKGMLNVENLTTFYRNARFLVMTSSCYEGFPIVFLEAMAHKLPVVAPNLAGNPEIIEENVNGLLFQPGSEHSLIAVINKLWNDQELSKKLSNKSIEKIQNKFGTKLFANKLEKVYDQLLKK